MELNIIISVYLLLTITLNVVHSEDHLLMNELQLPHQHARIKGLAAASAAAEHIRHNIFTNIVNQVYHNVSFWQGTHETLVDFNADNIGTKNNTQCIQDAVNLIQDALRLEFYALQVVDSVGKVPAGVLQGDLMWLGDYRSCVNATSMPNTSHSFRGKYCATSYYIPALGPVFANNPISVGLCVPHTCDNQTVAELLYIALKSLPIEVLPVTVICAEDKPITKSDIAAIVILSVLALVVTMGTAVDIFNRAFSNVKGVTDDTANPSEVTSVPDPDTYSRLDAGLVDSEVIDPGLMSPRYLHNQLQDDEKTSKWRTAKDGMKKVLIEMSVIRNGERILDTSKRSQGLAVLNGVRFLSMSWVILGHSYGFTPAFVDNPVKFLSVIKRFTFQSVVNGTYSVDTFFFLSGLLVAYLTLKELRRKDGKINWFLFYFHRYWRLTPTYMICLMFFVTLFLHTMDGPFKNGFDSSPYITICHTHWWTNLLYVNNFIPYNSDISCMAWAWYLANDMQFFIISPIFIYLLYRYRRIGLAAVVVAIAVSVSLTTGVAYSSNISVILTQNKNNNTAESSDVYFRPYYRISPYLVGIFTGYLLYLHKGHIRLSKLTVVLGWVVAVAINMAVLYGLYGHYHDSTTPGRLASAFYVGTSRFAWSLGLSWLTFACLCGYGGPVNKVLSWGAWTPLARLTYTAYLMHPMVIYCYILNDERRMHLTDYNMVYFYLGNMALSYAVAFVVTLLAEAPVIQLEKFVFRRA